MIGIKKVIKISQRDVLDFLKKNKGKWFTSRQLIKELDLSSGSIGSNLRKTMINKTIQRRTIRKKCYHTFEYSYLHQKEMIRKKPLPIKKLKERYEE
jgi:hypothetical protein